MSLLRDLVICPVCLDVVKEPRMLPCQHTFCLPCVVKLAHSHGAKDSVARSAKLRPVLVRCAQCRAETILPKGGASALPGNIYLQSVLDIVSSISSVQEEEESRPRCFECHTVCQARECLHCSRSFCPICEGRHLVEFESKLLCIQEQLVATKGRMVQRIRSFSELCDGVRESIHLEIQNRVKNILETEATLTREVDEIWDRGKSLGSDVAHRLEANVERISEVLRGGFEQAKTPAEKVSAFMDIHRESSECLDAADATSLGTLTFIPDTLTITDEKRTETVTAVQDEDEEPDPSQSHDSSEGNPDISLADRNVVTDNAHSLRYLSRPFLLLARLGSAFLQRPSGVAVAPWSPREIFVVSMDSHRVYVFDTDRMKFLRSFGARGQRPGEFLCPCGIALSPVTREILVTDKWRHCVHVFGSGETFLRQIGCKGSGPAQFRSPEAICVDKTGRIFVCDTINNRIQVLNKEGIFLRQIDGQAPIPVGHGPRQRQPLFQEPSGIAVSSDGERLVVCDSANHRIHVFGREGVHLLTCGQKGSLRGQFNHPECVAVDAQGFMLVGDSGNSRIQIFRPDGRYVRSFGTRGSLSGHFNWISGIAVTNKQEVIVCDFKNHCVQIF